MRNRLSLLDAARNRRQSACLQIRGHEHRVSHWQGRDLHAETYLRRQGRECTVTNALERRQAAVRRRQVCGPFGDGALLHRRAFETRGRCRRRLRSDNEQLQATGTGIRSPGNLAYSARNRSAAIRIPMFSTNPKLEAIGVSSTRSVVQRLPRLLGDAAGR